jgi:hypothetical protein
MMFDFLKTAKWNNGPNQKKLATMLWEAATYEVTRGTQGKSLNIHEWAVFTRNCGWSDKEASNRFIHAVTMIGPMADAKTYATAKEMAKNLYQAWRA